MNFTKAPFSIKEVFIVIKRSLLLSKGPYCSHKIPNSGRKFIVPKSVLTFFSMPILRLRSHRFSVESLSKFCCCLARSKSSWTVVVPVVNDVDVDVGDAGAAAALNKEARHEQALKLILNKLELCPELCTEASVVGLNSSYDGHLSTFSSSGA